MNGYEGMCMSRGKFLKPWQVRDKIIEWNFYASHIQLFTSDSNSKHNNSQGFENSWMVLRGCVWVGRKFLKPWQMTDNIIEWIFSQFTFNILWLTLTQKVITCRVLKIHKWIQGDVYELRESFSSHDKWYIILSECNHKIRVQECYGGVATPHLWCHVRSHHIIDMIGGGVGCVSQRGGSVMENSKLTTFTWLFCKSFTNLHETWWNYSVNIPT